MDTFPEASDYIASEAFGKAFGKASGKAFGEAFGEAFEDTLDKLVPAVGNIDADAASVAAGWYVVHYLEAAF